MEGSNKRMKALAEKVPFILKSCSHIVLTHTNNLIKIQQMNILGSFFSCHLKSLCNINYFEINLENLHQTESIQYFQM